MHRPHEEKTPYELWFGRKATVKHFKVFGSKCYIKRIEQNVGKFDEKADEGTFWVTQLEAGPTDVITKD